MKTDPFFLYHEVWQDAISHPVKMCMRAKQRALVKHGLNCAIDGYLLARFLP